MQVKDATILKQKYSNKLDMEKDLTDFLVHYLLYRRHGGLRKELNLKTPYQAILKWFELKPEIFQQNPLEYKNKILNLQHNKTSLHKQPCET